MHFIINSGDLLQRLNTLAKAQSNKNSLQILDCVKIDLFADHIRLTASDSNVTLITTLPVVDASDINQSICIKTITLVSALRELADQPINVSANPQTQEVIVTYNGGQFNFMAQTAQEYPDTSFNLLNAQTLTLSAETLRDGIQSTRIAVASDELRPIINGVCFDATTEGLNFVASDGHKLIRNTYHEIKGENPFQFVLPAKTADILLHILGKKNEDVAIEMDEKSIAFRTQEYTFLSRLIEGNYPNYNSVIPSSGNIIAHIDHDAVMAALRRVLVFADANTTLVQLQFDNNNLQLSAQDLAYAHASQENVTCEYNDEPITIGFKGTDLLDLLRTLPSGDLSFTMIDPTRATILTPDEQAEENNILLLLMPMMLKS